jgi:hypothetical protein
LAGKYSQNSLSAITQEQNRSFQLVEFTNLISAAGNIKIAVSLLPDCIGKVFTTWLLNHWKFHADSVYFPENYFDLRVNGLSGYIKT